MATSLDKPFSDIGAHPFTEAERVYIRSLLYGNGKKAINGRVADLERDMYGDKEKNLQGAYFVVKRHEDVLERVKWTLSVATWVVGVLGSGIALGLWRLFGVIGKFMEMVEKLP